LQDSFSPVKLSVVDESHLHIGHAGSNDDGESHFFIEIISPDFVGKTRVAAHRLINDALSGEFETGLHALRLKTGTP